MTKYLQKVAEVDAWRVRDLFQMSEKRETFPEPVEELFQKGQLFITRCPNHITLFPGGSRTIYAHLEDWLIFDNDEWRVMSPFHFENKYREVKS